MQEKKPSNQLDDLVISIGDDTATIDLSGLESSSTMNYDFSYNGGSYDTITIGGISGAAGNSSNGSYYISNGTGGTGTFNWSTTTTASPYVTIGNDGIDIREEADIKIGNRSLKEFMEKMEERLAILVPDPKKLEHFEALKKAYEHYKTLEALCELPKKEEE